MKAKNQRLYSFFYLFEGPSFQKGKNKNKQYEPYLTDSIGAYVPNAVLKKRIDELRKFALDYFTTKSITLNNWFGLLKIDQNILERGDFDMILQVKTKTQIKSVNTIDNYWTYHLVDSKKNTYFMNYDSAAFQDGVVVKIRSVCRM